MCDTRRATALIYIYEEREGKVWNMYSKPC